MERHRNFGGLRVVNVDSNVWALGTWNEREGSGSVHAIGKVLHDRCRLDMEVAEHFVTAPSTDKANDVSVDTGA